MKHIYLHILKCLLSTGNQVNVGTVKQMFTGNRSYFPILYHEYAVVYYRVD